MTTATHPNTATDWASPVDIEYARRVAAMIFGVRMLGVISGFTRGVFQLGLEMGSVMIRLANAGKDTESPNAELDLAVVMRLLRRALHIADALRVRLRTPAVIKAMQRKRSPGQEGAAKPRPARDPNSPLAKVLERISFGRRDKEMCAQWQEAIAGLSDREVLQYLYSDLKQAAALLGETVEATRIEKWACRAAVLLAHAEATEAAAAQAAKAAWQATQPVDRRAPDAATDVEPEAAAEPDGVADSRPSHAAGCGPP